LPVLLVLLAVVGLILVADARELIDQLRAFNIVLLVPVLLLSLVNYGLRFGRWQLYLSELEISLALKTSLVVFLVGFVLSVTPGKAGELGKAWMVRELGGGAARRTVAVVIGERVSDLLGIIVLVGVGALAFPGGFWLTVVCFMVSGTGLVLLVWSRAAEWFVKLVSRLPWLGRRSQLLADIYEDLRFIQKPPVLVVSLLLSVLAWGAEGVGFGIVARAYDPATTWTGGIFTYSASTFVGAASMIPGGLLASEGALAMLLGIQGMGSAAAASATLVIRAATLWFAVLLGLVALPIGVKMLATRVSRPPTVLGEVETR
jgi:uncharacterized protein (TIRG00374 family)